MRAAARLVGLGLVGCGPAPAPGPCVPATELVLSPADGATDVPPDAGVSVHARGALDGAAVWIDGGLTDGWQAVDDQGAVALRAALGSETTHWMRVRQCGSIVAESRFSTGPGPVGDGLRGRVFLFDLMSRDLAWAQPTTVPDPMLLRALLSDTRGVLLAPQADGAVVAVAEDETGEVRQDACLPTVAGASLGEGDPEIAVGPVDVSFDGEAPTIEQMVLTGVAVDGGARIRDLRLQGRVDMRRVGGSTGVALCGALQVAYGSTCLPCADQAETDDPVCMLLDATMPSAVGLDVDVTADPTPHSWCR